MKDITILGSGMAGLGAAYRASKDNIKTTLYDKNDHPGGHTASWTTPEGFIFDEGPHISFTKDERIQELMAESLGGEYESFGAYVNNYWKGHWVKHPAQCNLHGLPTDLLVNVIKDFMLSLNAEANEINNYADWLIASYGRTFAETFPMEYGLRYHTTTADNMSTDWLGPRLYRPDLDEVLAGALSPETKDVHYVKSFRYPSNGGFEAYLKGFVNNSTIELSHELIKVNASDKKLWFQNGKELIYENLISSIPLPLFIPMIEGVPLEVSDAANKLACTSCMTVNIGIERENISPAHWSYFYDKDFIFTRLSFPHMFAPNNAPSGCSSIQAEIYYSDKYLPLAYTAEECIDRTIADLERCGLLKSDDNILYKGAKNLPFANIIFDLDREAALKIVLDYLKEIDIHVAGRYGMWGYQWTDESFKNGESAVEQILGS